MSGVAKGSGTSKGLAVGWIAGTKGKAIAKGNPSLLARMGSEWQASKARQGGSLTPDGQENATGTTC